MWVLPLGQKDPLGRAWQPTPIFLPGESHGQKIYGATVHWVTESDTTEVTEHTHGVYMLILRSFPTHLSSLVTLSSFSVSVSFVNKLICVIFF